MKNYFLIGTYSDGSKAIVGEYPTRKDAEGGKRWQDKLQMTGVTNDIYKPTENVGEFKSVTDGHFVVPDRGAYTWAAFDAILKRVWGSK